MVDRTYTTIAVSLETKVKLDSLKIHPRQSYSEVVRMLLDRLDEGQ